LRSITSQNDVGPDALRPKSDRAAFYINQIVHMYLVPQWDDSIADDLKTPRHPAMT
jgi:hypothetical protein